MFVIKEKINYRLIDRFPGGKCNPNFRKGCRHIEQFNNYFNFSQTVEIATTLE